MTQWPSTKANLVLKPVLKIGWSIQREKGTSHKVHERQDWPDYVFTFHDRDEIGPKMLAGIAKKTGLTPEDL